MIQLVFMIGSSMRRVIINKRRVSMIAQETGWVPMIFDLDNLSSGIGFKKLNEEEKRLLEEIGKLKTEKDMAKDIIKDFNSTGWRLFKRTDGDN